VNRRELISELAATLGATHEARFICDEVLGPDANTPVTDAAIRCARELAARRRSGEPLQYLLGHWPFRTVDLQLNSHVLIPRPETEQVVEVALAELQRLAPAKPSLVDAGTGSGAIALSLATELAVKYPNGEVWATDASPEALTVAAANWDRVRHHHAATVLPVTFVAGNWLKGLPPELRGSIDLVIANPPYVAAAEWPELADDVRREPRQALVAADGSDGTPGLADVETVLTQALDWLSRPGTAVIELAPQQAEAAVVLARAMGYDHARVEPDLAQRPRALVCRVQ
jgi:release factor glutamine methyltransferase